MVWDSITHGVEKAASFNHWPNPFNFLKNARVLMCNNDYWLAEFEFAFDLIANFFWTQVIPSPRELERKTFTGGYRCGFYLDVNIKSPLEIVFGQGTSRMVGEIAAPFAQGLFYFWALGAGIEAFAIWETVMFHQYLCDPFKGDVLRRDDIMPMPPGHTEGIPGLGTLSYDPLHICGPSQPFVLFPPGGWHVYAVWMFNAGPTGLTNIETGWWNGTEVVGRMSHGNAVPGQQVPVIREAQGWSAGGFDIGAWAAGDSGPSVAGSAALCIRFIADWEPLAQPFPDDYFYEPVADDPRRNPMCAQSFF